MLDCRTTGGRHEVARNWKGSARTSVMATDGHIVLPLPKDTSNGRATFQIASLSTFALSSCEVVPLQ
jgi:hypothetical protein